MKAYSISDSISFLFQCIPFHPILFPFHCLIPIWTSYLWSFTAPKRIDRFWCAWCQSLAFFKLYIRHVKKLKINQEKAELLGIGCQWPPEAWFSHFHFGHLPKNCHSFQTSWPIFMSLVAFACISEALYDTCQKIKNRSRKSRVMGWKRSAFFVRRLKKSDFPIPILTSCLWSVIQGLSRQLLHKKMTYLCF